ncbi:MAG: MOSC domain-containing protein [Actinomycetota bacterium]|nr:MOSC domain-containing protein [Actinomycetota bacterium]
MVRTVSRLSITPVKSTALIHPDQVMLEGFGVAENRRFYAINRSGRLLGANRHGPLLAIRSRWEPEQGWLTLLFPDGAEVSGPAEPHGEVRTTVFWGRPVEGREVAGPFSAALSGYVGAPVRLMMTERPGDGNDSHAASLVSTASVEELARQAGRADGDGVGDGDGDGDASALVDARRFRMLIEVDGCEPHEEDSWVGREVQVGGAIIRVIRRDPRCVITTLDPDTGLPDFDTLGTIKSYRYDRDRKELPFGVYANVEEPGIVRVGDEVEPLG